MAKTKDDEMKDLAEEVEMGAEMAASPAASVVFGEKVMSQMLSAIVSKSSDVSLNAVADELKNS